MIDYQSAGVNIDIGNDIVQRIKGPVQSTFGPSILSGLGGFASLLDLRAIMRDYEEPLLVQSMDGIGTKTLIASMMQRYNTLGEDLLSATVNDILVYGARPLTLLDYIGSATLSPDEVVTLIEGLSEACHTHQVALVGGDTAEMPGMYAQNGYSLVGVITGVVDKKNLVDGRTIRPGDKVLGLASSGLHTNGYSLARKLCFEVAGLHPNTVIDELGTHTLGDVLLTPHRNYLNPVHTLLEHYTIKGMAHITGGGLLENIPRVLPSGCGVVLNSASWPSLPIFDYLVRLGKLDKTEAFRTFNMGIGFVLIVDKAHAPLLLDHNADLYEIGDVIAGAKQVWIE